MGRKYTSFFLVELFVENETDMLFENENENKNSDHAWGGNYFAASGSLKGGKILGEYPDDLTSSGSRIVSDVGIVVPTTPWEALWNGIAEWFGVTR